MQTHMETAHGYCNTVHVKVTFLKHPDSKLPRLVAERHVQWRWLIVVFGQVTSKM